jgi:hypothetical protein
MELRSKSPQQSARDKAFIGNKFPHLQNDYFKAVSATVAIFEKGLLFFLSAEPDLPAKSFLYSEYTHLRILNLLRANTQATHCRNRCNSGSYSRRNFP